MTPWSSSSCAPARAGARWLSPGCAPGWCSHEPLHRQVPSMQRGDLWPFGRPTLSPRQGGSGSRGCRLHVRAHQGPAGSGRARRARPRLPSLWAPLVRKGCPGPLQREAPVWGAVPFGHGHHLRVFVRWQKPRSRPRGVAVSGYVPCACRDCFEIAIASGDEQALCWECEEAGCEAGEETECCVESAYGGEECS